MSEATGGRVSFDDLPSRFKKRARLTNSGCWVYDVAPAGNGYTRFKSGNKNFSTHRYIYEQLVGQIPEGLQLDHLCRERRCINPAHLEPVTQRENILRGTGISARNAQKTHCKRGHEFTPKNTYYYPGRKPDSAPWRICIECRRLRNRSAESTQVEPQPEPGASHAVGDSHPGSGSPHKVEEPLT